MYDNEEKRQAMAKNALELAKTAFNRDNLAHKYLDAINNMTLPKNARQNLEVEASI